jgi:microsomal dipeptidase-like Zn-dependent dipeptidase
MPVVFTTAYDQRLTRYEQNGRFIETLYKHKFGDKEVGKILGGNFLRVMREVLPA